MILSGITFGSFDLLHAGHVTMLNECKRQCDWLIVGLQTDPTIDRPQKNKPVQTTFERWVQLEALKCVDQIIPYDTEQDLLNMLSILNVDRRFIGDDYREQYIHGRSICEQKNIEIVYIRRQHTYSSSELRKRIYASQNK
jgi:glycerol-3-phosphate cytidylyltransferase